MTPLTTIQSWSRDQLESAFTQREGQLSQTDGARNVWIVRAADTATEMNNWRTRAQHAEEQRDQLKQQLEHLNRKLKHYEH